MLNLEKLLARNLGCPRREARRLLATHGHDLPESLRPEDLPFRLTLGKETLELHDSFHLMLNKPAGCVTALDDRRHETVARYVRDAPLSAELRPVGRLDLDSTGLLLWTSDGTWLHRLTHPRSAIPRCYHAALARPFASLPKELRLLDGHQPTILDLRVLPETEAHPSLHRPAASAVFASITIVGGAYHEVRRIFAALDSHVLGLCRISFGEIVLPRDLEPGQWLPIRSFRDPVSR